MFTVAGAFLFAAFAVAETPGAGAFVVAAVATGFAAGAGAFCGAEAVEFFLLF